MTETDSGYRPYVDRLMESDGSTRSTAPGPMPCAWCRLFEERWRRSGH